MGFANVLGARGPRAEETVMTDVKFRDRGVHEILDNIARKREDPGLTHDVLWRGAQARGVPGYPSTGARFG